MPTTGIGSRTLEVRQRKPSGSDLFGGFFFLFLFLLTVVPFPFSFFSFRSGSKGGNGTYPVKGSMKKLFFVLLFLPFAGYGQEITITQSQKIDLKLPYVKDRPDKGNQKAKGLLIAGAALSAAGVGIGISGSVSRPGQDRVLRRVGSGVVAVGAGFTIAGVVKLK